jgi:hypothetical protein
MVVISLLSNSAKKNEQDLYNSDSRGCNEVMYTCIQY